MKPMLELYSSILGAVGLVADADGFISTKLPGSDTTKPFIIDQRRAVLPIPSQLKETDWTSRIGFHPFLQKVEEGESKVIDKFRDRMNAYGDFMTGMLMLQLADLATQKDKHINLSPGQSVYLGPMSDADDKFVKLIKTFVATNRIAKKGNEFIRFSLIKGRTFGGRKRTRVAVLHFPLYEAVCSNDSPITILGHKLRGKDVKMIKATYELLFPGIGEKEVWEIPSDSLIAASIDSLMAIYGKYANSQNNVVSVLGEWLEAGSELYITTDWQEDMTKLDQYRSQIISIPWLEGSSGKVAASTGAAMVNPNTFNQPAPQTIVQPPVMHQQAPQQTSVYAQPVYQQPAAITAAIANTQPGANVVNNQQNADRPRLGVPRTALATGVGGHQITDQQVAQIAHPVQPYPTGPQAGVAYIDPNVVAQQQLLAQQQQLQMQQFHQQQLQQQQLAQQPQKLPESVRLFNGQMYIPVESTGVSAPPVGAIVMEGKLYAPFGVGAAAPAQAIPGQYMAPQPAAFGQFQRPTDPSQVPGLSVEEINFFRQQPLMFQNYLNNLQGNSIAVQQQQFAARTNQVPRYLVNAVQAAQQQNQQNQQYQQYGQHTLFN